MGVFSHGLSRRQQALAAVRQRGIVQSQIGYSSFPWNTHPDDQYLRVVPVGPFSQAWQGIQKVNLISFVGTRRASMYSPQPVYLRQLQANTGYIVRSNIASGAVGAGPALQASLTDEVAATGNASSLKALIVQRMFGKT